MTRQRVIHPEWRPLRCKECGKIALFATRRMWVGEHGRDFMKDLRWHNGAPIKPFELPQCPHCKTSFGQGLTGLDTSEAIATKEEWQP